MTTCSVDGCEQTYRVRRGHGLCSMHYQRLKNRGTTDPNPMVMQNAPAEVRFWAKVDRSNPDGCWEWQASRNRKGYGQWRVRGGWSGSAHRYAYTVAVGPIPDGLLIRHTCDNPPCCNPAHLLPGTVKDNAQDAVDRGRLNSSVGLAVSAARRAAKTECKYGHRYDEANTYRRPDGRRACRTCILIRKGRLPRSEAA